jgi:hypothetical protein
MTVKRKILKIAGRGLAWAGVCALAGAANLHAQSGPIEATQATTAIKAEVTGRFRIEGILVNAVTGEPVRRATVSALAEEDSHAVASVVTDGEGRFSLDRLAAAKYQLTASKRGFRTAFYDEHQEFSTAIVTGADQDTSHLNFRITPGSILRGVVTDDGGDAVEGARVMLFQRSRRGGDGERTQQVDAAVTDDAGSYEFPSLAAGEYLLAVVAEPWYATHNARTGAPGQQTNESAAALDVAYPVTYYDSTTEEASATPIVLTGGSQEEANINLHAVPALRLSIAVSRRADGSPARPELQKTVFGTVVQSESGGFIDSMKTGTVEMTGVAPGQYQLLQGDPVRVVDLDLSASQPVDPNAGNPASTVAGTLRMASGLPVENGVTLTLAREDGGRGQTEFATPALGGRFKFDNVPAGVWSLLAEGGAKAVAVVDVSVGGVRRLGNVITVRDRSVDAIVTLSEGNTRIEGFARKDGKGLAGAMVVLAPADRANWQALTRRDQSDSDGSFALRDVAPGKYTIFAIEDGWGLDWARPEAMARYLPGGTAVTLTDKSGALVRLTTPVAVQTR